MKITVNGEPREISTTSLEDALRELGYGEAKVATAVNEAFVAAPARSGMTLEPGDRLEVVTPRQGG
ncbi:sulfur carrier protein [Poseidonocella pacifica]|uniref:Sulfur carrier protein n=1 Tax=Poseidonocella pacifica TaxID=871651 RepID=A0A1I0YH09_9RHOB|nr:sulfur carrier protein ThiS [Poseidonocella pacifica]SFB11443.1 sulfur carrier protein [Poseidonocella pacifica]